MLGLREFKTLEDMTNAEVLVICNMKPNKMRGFEFRGDGVVRIKRGTRKSISSSRQAASKIGERVTFEGFEGNQRRC